ncbi:MAG: hypothetical protein ACKVOR_06795, partial [Flavobacteriales bacterium]
MNQKGIRKYLFSHSPCDSITSCLRSILCILILLVIGNEGYAQFFENRTVASGVFFETEYSNG